MTELDPRLIGNPGTAVGSVTSTDVITISRDGVSHPATIATLAALLGTDLTIDGIISGINTELGGTAWQSGGGSSVWGAITGTIGAQSDLVALLGDYVTKSGATMTGALVALSFSVASGHLVSVVGNAIRTAYDSNDYYEYDKANNVYLFVIGGNEKLRLGTTLDVKSQRIVNVATPTDDNDAVTKAYLTQQLEAITPGSGDGLPAGGTVGGVQFYKSPGVFGQDGTFYIDEVSHTVHAKRYINAIDRGGASIVTVSGTFNPTLSAQTIIRNVTGSNFVLGAPTGYTPPADTVCSYQLILKNIDAVTKTFTAPSYQIHGYAAPQFVLLPNVPTEFWLLHYEGVWRIAGPPVSQYKAGLWFPGAPPTSTPLHKEFVYGALRVPLNPLSLGAVRCEVAPTATTIVSVRRISSGGVVNEHLRATFTSASVWGTWTAYVSGSWTSLDLAGEAAVVNYAHGEYLQIDPPRGWNGLQGLLMTLMCGV